MSEKAEATEMVLNKIDEYMNAAKTVIETYGGDVADLGLLALRIEAGSTLIMPIIFVIVLGIVSPRVYRSIGWVKSKMVESSYEPWPLLFLGHVLYAIVFAAAIDNAVNLWAWVGLFYPEAYAVHLFLLK